MNLFRVNSFIFFFTLLQCLLGCIKKIYFGCIRKKFCFGCIKKNFVLVVLEKNLNFPVNFKKVLLINATFDIFTRSSFFFKNYSLFSYCRKHIKNLSTFN